MRKRKGMVPDLYNFSSETGRAKKHHKSKRKWICLDCARDTSKMKEHFYVSLSVWKLAHDSERGMLCIGCLEARIGRMLTPLDFTDAHINDPKRNEMSDRLRSRILG